MRTEKEATTPCLFFRGAFEVLDIANFLKS